MVIGMTLVGEDKQGEELCLDVQVESDGSAWVEIRRRARVHVEARVKVRTSELSSLLATLLVEEGKSP